MRSAKPDTWMPLFVGDYLSDTTHLSTEEHGAYLLLLMTAWMRGGQLPNDDAQLARIARADKKSWAALKPSLMPFFEADGDRLINRRLADEYEKAVKNNETQKANGSKGGRPRKTQNVTQNQTKTGTQEKPTGFDRDNPNHNPNETPSPSPKPVNPPQGEGGGISTVVRVPPESPATPPTDGFAMDLGWEPSDHFASLARQAGLPLPDTAGFEASKAEFRSYWLTRSDTLRTQHEWDHALLKSLQRDQLRSASMPKAPAGAQPMSREQQRISAGIAIFGNVEQISEDARNADIIDITVAPARIRE